MRLVRILVIVPIVLLGVVAAANGEPRAEPSAEPRAEPSAEPSADGNGTDDAGKLLLVLDASGSMAEDAGGGQTRIEAAKDALRTVVDELPDDAEVGLRVYGSDVFSRDDPGACTDTKNVVPVSPLDRKKLTSAIKDYKPHGETPIGNALKGAAKDLGTEGKRTIVLLSDGEPTCPPDPCKVAKKIRKQGIDTRINVVGLDVSGKARRVLKCIAESGGGTYYDADTAEELAHSLITVSVRPFREFSISGDPVSGANNAREAQNLNPGTYRDSIDAGQERYYKVSKPDGGRVVASVTARPELGKKSKTTEAMRMELLTPTGEVCKDEHANRTNVLRTRSILGASVTYGPDEFSAKDACDDAEQMVLRVTWADDAQPTDYQLDVRALGAATNAGQLPDAIEDTEKYMKPVEAGSKSKPVMGAGSFTHAPRLETGTFSDTIRPGEQLLYRIPVDWGQSARASVTVDPDRMADNAVSIPGVAVSADMFTPFHHELTSWNKGDAGVRANGLYQGSDPLALTTLTPPVRYRNAGVNDYEVESSYFAGDYYLSLQMSDVCCGDSEHFAAPITIAVDVSGDEAGEPEFASMAGPGMRDPTAEDPGAAAHDQGNGNRGWILAAGLGAAAVALIAIIAVVVVRRRAS